MDSDTCAMMRGPPVSLTSLSLKNDSTSRCRSGVSKPAAVWGRYANIESPGRAANHTIIVLLQVIVSERSGFDMAGQTEQQEHRVDGLKLAGGQCFQRL